MMKNNMFMDIHVIQTVPPSCVNRDDTGSPKAAVYGGVERARVSSQAWKHAMREYFRNEIDADKVGSRTKQLPQKLADAVLKLQPDFGDNEALDAALAALKIVGIKLDEKKNQNAALFFISEEQTEALAKLIVARESNKDAYKKAIKDYPSFDIALFGRMVADDPSLNYDAASQVAHAISTHGVHTEYDYFTAVDDEQQEEESGAGHLGTVEFNSATLYRYATLNIAELALHLGKDTPLAAKSFAQAFICAMPTGKQNTFANRTLPDMVYLTLRRDQPVNLSGAFEAPVKNEKGGFAVKSCEALLAYAEHIYAAFADKPEKAYGCGAEQLFANCAKVLPLKKLLDELEADVENEIAE